MLLDELHSQYHAGNYFTVDDNRDRLNSPSYLIPCHPSLPSFALSPLSTFDQSFAVEGGAGAGRLMRELDVSALPPPDPVAGMERLAAGAAPVVRKRKRFRTDRHSKIHTSQGLRDRRMRLSLDVARQFFSLQDMLGFDKASHTVNWLLHQSKTAIEQLIAGSSKLVIDHETLNAAADDVFFTDTSNSDGEHLLPDLNPAADALTKVQKGSPSFTEAAFDTKFSRRSRDKVRARAREKTARERKRDGCQGTLSDVCRLDQLMSSKTTTGLEETVLCDGSIYERTAMAVSPWHFHGNHDTMDDFLEEQLQ